MNKKLIFTALTGTFIILLGLTDSVQAKNTPASSKRVFTNTSTMNAFKVDITLPAIGVGDDNKYTWVSLKNQFDPNFTYFVPNQQIPMKGGTISNFMTMPPVVFANPGFEKPPESKEGKLEVVTSSLKKDTPLPATKVVFKKADGTIIAIDDKPSTPKVSLKNAGTHNSTTDGFGGSSEFAMVLSNFSTTSIAITGFRLFQNIEMAPFIAALEGNIPSDLYLDPINTIGTGELVSNIMPNFTLNAGEELAFHFDADFDPNLIGISSGFCNGNFECSDSAMVPVPEPTSTLGFLSLVMLGAASSLKHKLKPSKSTEKETTKVG